MQFITRLGSALRNIFRTQHAERALDAEINSYAGMAMDELISAGMSAAEARRTVLAELGGIEQVKQNVRDQRSGAFIELLVQDARYALRQLRRNPGFTITAVVTLGLGIGATTTIFSAVYALLLRPLPYHHADRLVSIASGVDTGANNLLDPDFVAARVEIKSFEQLAAFHLFMEDNLTGAGDPMRVTRAAVTANFFSTLGVMPQLGRNFTSEEDWSGAPNVLLLSDHFWRNVYSANPGIVGKAITLNGASYTVVGVLPPHFSFPGLYLEPDIYGTAVLERGSTVSIEKPLWGIQPIARLRSGVSMAQAQAEVQAYFQARAHGYPVELKSWARERQMTVESLQRHLVGDDRKPLYILLFSVGVVLLISCANVANLQLARGVTRRQEMALRGALGASRRRLVWQLLVESLILSVFAAVIGLAVALVATAFVRHLGALSETMMAARTARLLSVPFGKLSAAVAVDGWMLAFTIGLAMATTLLFGLAPAIAGSRTDLRTTLQSAAMRMSAGRKQRWLRHGLLVAEVSMAVVLLISAVLLVRSFVRVMSYDAGFDASHTLTGATSPHTGVSSLSGPGTAWPKEHYMIFVRQLLVRLRALPGVRAAALTSTLPLAQAYSRIVVPDGLPLPPIAKRDAESRTDISPDYFRAIGTTLLIGRDFNDEDNETSLPVAIVNSAFAKRFFAGNALGKRFQVAEESNVLKPLTVIGVVEDVRHDLQEREAKPEFFQPLAQDPGNSDLKLVLRTDGEPALLMNGMRAALTAADPRQALFDVATMDQRVSDLVARRRFIMMLVVCFAMIAVVLSAVGVYGVFTYAVTQREKEMGIRLALGASRWGLLGLVVMQAARLVALGGALGMVAALLSARLLSSLLVGVTPRDPLSFSLACILTTLVALIASAIPAAHAARTDLISVLHSE